MSRVKKQTITLKLEKNGTSMGLASDVLTHEFDYELPDDFSTGVHIIGAKTGETIHISDTDNPNLGGAEPTGWVTMVAELVTDRDIERMVGKVLTVIDATISDRDQKTAFKSLVKQAIYGQYNEIRARSYQTIKEPTVYIGEPANY